MCGLIGLEGEPCDARVWAEWGAVLRGCSGRAQGWLGVAGAAFCEAEAHRPLTGNHLRSVAGVQRPVSEQSRAGQGGNLVCRDSEGQSPHWRLGLGWGHSVHIGLEEGLWGTPP